MKVPAPSFHSASPSADWYATRSHPSSIVKPNSAPEDPAIQPLSSMPPSAAPPANRVAPAPYEYWVALLDADSKSDSASAVARPFQAVIPPGPTACWWSQVPDGPGAHASADVSLRRRERDIAARGDRDTGDERRLNSEQPENAVVHDRTPDSKLIWRLTCVAARHNFVSNDSADNQSSGTGRRPWR